MALCNLNLSLTFNLFVDPVMMNVVKNRLVGYIGEYYDLVYVHRNRR